MVLIFPRPSWLRAGPVVPRAIASASVNTPNLIGDLRPSHSLAVMPASLITGPHLSISRLRKVVNSAGDEATTTTPSCSSRCLVTGSVIAATVSAWSFAMISGGVLAGTKIAYQEDTSNPGTPNSASGAKSGAAGVRFAVVTPRPRSLSAWISGSTAPILLNMTSTRPGSRSLSAGPAPRYGTWSISTLASRLNSSPERCTEVPWPDDAKVTLPLLALA